MNLYYGEMSRARPERKTHSVSATLGDERYERLSRCAELKIRQSLELYVAHLTNFPKAAPATQVPTWRLGSANALEASIPIPRYLRTAPECCHDSE